MILSLSLPMMDSSAIKIGDIITNRFTHFLSMTLAVTSAAIRAQGIRRRVGSKNCICHSSSPAARCLPLLPKILESGQGSPRPSLHTVKARQTGVPNPSTDCSPRISARHQHSTHNTHDRASSSPWSYTCHLLLVPRARLGNHAANVAH